MLSNQMALFELANQISDKNLVGFRERNLCDKNFLIIPLGIIERNFQIFLGLRYLRFQR